MLTEQSNASDAQFALPVGNGDYVVQQGDCLQSIAFAHGLLWQTIWNHSRNAPLRQAGRNPNILLPGDRLYVPDVDVKTEDAATGQRHKYRLDGSLAKIQLQVLQWVRAEDGAAEDDGLGRQTAVPRAGVAYVLAIDGELFSGNLDDDGWLIREIPADAQGGNLTVEPGTENAFEISLLLGGLDPIEAASGIWQRLVNLGFGYGNNCGPDSQAFREAVSVFQEANGITPTGQVDQALRDALKGLHLS